MKTLNHLSTICLAATVVLGAAAPVLADVPLASAGPVRLSAGGRLQMLGFGESLQDPYKSGNRLYLFQKESRLWLSADSPYARFFTQLALGGEDQVLAPNPGIALTLLDMNAEVPVGPFGRLKVGQFKVPYGREQLTNSGALAFNDRSIDNLGFQTGRDVGVALVKHAGAVTAIGGVFTGGGRDTPQRYLPEILGVPLLAARVGYGAADTDPFALSQQPLGADATRQSFFLNGLYTRDSKVGHSTILNIKGENQSLLTDPNWNPFLARSPLAQGDFYQVGADWSLVRPWASRVIAAEAEVNYGGFSNSYGALHLAGGRAQVGVIQGPAELALRYAVLIPDAGFAAYDATSGKSYPITGSAPIHEITPGVTYFLNGENLKLTLDFPILVNTPVLTETNVGSYVATDMPDETSVLKGGGSVARQVVYEARLGLQYQF